MRRLAPELLVTAKTQRWSPEEFLRTLDRSRDRITRRVQRHGTAQGRRVPRHQDHRRVRPRRLVGPSRRPSTTSRRSSGSPHQRTCASSAPPGPARATCSSRSATPPSTPGNGSATSPPPSSSRPSTAARRQQRRPRHRDHPPRRPDPDRRDRVRPTRPDRRPTVLPARRRRLRTTLARHRLALALRGLGPVHPRTHHRRQPPRPAPVTRAIRAFTNEGSRLDRNRWAHGRSDPLVRLTSALLETVEGQYGCHDRKSSVTTATRSYPASSRLPYWPLPRRSL